MMGSRVGFCTVVGVATLACGGDLTGSLWRLEPGFIGVPPVVAVPDTVSANTPFTATVTTRGSSSCRRASGAEVGLQPSIIEVVPLDSVSTGAHACTDDLAAFPRAVTLQFGATGLGIIRVRGRGFDGDLTVEDTVVVR